MPVIVDALGRAVIPFVGRDYPLSRARLVQALPLDGSRTLSPAVLLASSRGAAIGDASGTVIGIPQRHVSRLVSAGRVASTRTW
jgi:hypothetical protein